MNYFKHEKVVMTYQKKIHINFVNFCIKYIPIIIKTNPNAGSSICTAHSSLNWLFSISLIILDTQFSFNTKTLDK